MILRNASARRALKDFNWIWKPFSELTLLELYSLIQARETVFVVEQKLSYVDCDDYDQKGRHLLGYHNGKLLAYLRAFPPGVKYEEASLGRVLVMKEGRNKGLGKELTKMGLEKIQQTFGNVSIKISAQAHLLKFYSEFGFRAVSEVYMEEGIPHIKMLRDPV